jgi:hypothetical protein
VGCGTGEEVEKDRGLDTSFVWENFRFGGDKTMHRTIGFMICLCISSPKIIWLKVHLVTYIVRTETSSMLHASIVESAF